MSPAVTKAQLVKKFQALETLIQKELDTANQVQVDNTRRRVLYSDVELIRLDLTELALKQNATIEGDGIEEDISKRMDVLLKLLKLVPIKRKRRWWSPLEVIVRFVGVSCSIMLVGMICSLPLLLMRALDQLMKVDPFKYRSEYFKRCIAWFFLFESGIETEVEGLDWDYFKESCALMTFTHASNIDGFLVSGTCPIRQLAFGKKELFVVPFFSWISLAFGGVPVDRNNRDRAVKALKRSTDAAKHEKLCIAIAPEGTRSMTGHLLPFKKGTFYMWEEMQAPIVPFVIFGAYDLYPVGSWVNQTGVVAVRYLPPIYPSAATDKEHMMRLVRRRMLESLRECPASIGRDLSTAAWARSILGNLAVTALTLVLSWLGHALLVVRWGLSGTTIALGWAGGVVAITAWLYVYYVYIVDAAGGSAATGAGTGAGTGPKASSKSRTGLEGKQD